MNDTIHDRISRIVRQYAHGKNTEMAQKLGVSEGNIRGYIKGVLPKADFLEKIVTNYEVSAYWLLTGEGEMARKAEDTESSKPLEEDAVPLISGQNHLIDVIRQQAEEIGTLKEKLRNAEKSTRRNSEDS